ncbi:ATP-binding protein [Pseudoduganella chitinolytica]|uniref:histidine kinase n=1 Tax=Pseudoduganella chitinolytica TaxID=34070 RepID=A0ABY8BF56_9BURK|nr:ATP-binding protein [Pseudoduganella chitinolytica]WEF33606.1 ATP-binding protein [Pseudoduganella chitinolytica]
MRIRTRLLLLILSILLPAFAIASVAVWYVYNEQRAAEVAGMQEAARALALLADRDLQAREAVLATLASSPAMQRGDLRAVYEHARQLAPGPDMTIVVHDLAGRQLFNTRQSLGSPPAVGRSNLMALRQAAGPHGVVVSDLFYAPVGKRYDVALQIPVTVEGQLRYYLSMGLAVERIMPLLGQHGVPENWVISLLDRRGTVIARTSDPARYVGRSVSAGLRARIAASPAGMHKGVRLDGTPTFAFFSRAPMSGWTVVMSVPAAEMRRPAVAAAAGLGLLVAIVLALAIVAARIYARGTAAPIERLRQAAERLGRDEPVVPFASGLAEADAVSAALADASTLIAGSKAHLEQRVAEAVAQAERAQRALLHGQKLEALGRLTAGIAHDFNNILQTLSGALQLIPLTDDRARVQALAATCQKAIARATTLTGQMRAFGTVQDARLETIQPDSVVENTLPMLRSALPGTVRLELDIAAGLWPVTVDPLQLELALLNLVINARDAMPDGGRLYLGMHNEQLADTVQGLAPGPYVRIELRDNGTGMTPATLARALEPFFTTKPVDKGTGLGLPQAYAFAAQSGGLLTLQSATGDGTTVTIRLPRTAVADAPAQGVPASGA